MEVISRSSIQLGGYMSEEIGEQRIPAPELVNTVIQCNKTANQLLVEIVEEGIKRIWEGKGKASSVIIVVGEYESFEYQGLYCSLYLLP